MLLEVQKVKGAFLLSTNVQTCLRNLMVLLMASAISGCLKVTEIGR